MEEIKCPICKNEAIITDKKNAGNFIWYHCKICGFFALKSFKFKCFNFDKYNNRNKLMYAIKKLSNKNNDIEIDSVEQLDEIVDRVNFPETIEQKTDLLLQFIIDHERDLNDGCTIGTNHIVEFALKNGNELKGLISYAEESGLIITAMKCEDGEAHCKLKNIGRKRLNEIKQKSKRDKNMIIEIKRNTHFSETMLKALEAAENEISQGNPEHAHDRMHTFLHDYLIQLCAKLSLKPKSKEPNIMELFSLITQYLNMNNSNKVTIKILRAFSTALHDINYIRNKKSLVHPKKVLKKPEAMFVINTIKTIYVYLEEKLS